MRLHLVQAELALHDDKRIVMIGSTLNDFEKMLTPVENGDQGIEDFEAILHMTSPVVV